LPHLEDFAVIIQSITIVAPIFALIALGFASVRGRVVSRNAGDGLSEFVFVLAIPALLFRTVATADLPPVNPAGYWIAYFVPLALVWITASIIAGKFGRDSAERAVIGFSAAQSNTVLVGIPLVLGVFGDAGKVPVVLILVLHLPITMTVVTLLIERGSSGHAGRRIIRALFTHPILLGILSGVLWRQTGWVMPEIPRSFLKFLGDAAAPCALVATGMSLSQLSLRGSRMLIVIVTMLKLMLHPLLVWGLAVWVFALPPVWVGVAVIFAACPTGINAFLVAERYRKGEAVASGAIALGTLLAVITETIVVAAILGTGGR
jgi:predicted permease